MDAERDAGAERRAVERRVDPGLVEAVADLVHDREDPAEVLLVPARGDADVVPRDARHERVHRVVDAPGVVVVAEAARDLAARSRAARPTSKRPGQRRRAPGARRSPRPAGRARRAARAKTSRTVADGRARLVDVEQRVVGVLGVREAGGELAAQLDVALEERLEAREVAARAGLAARPAARRRSARAISAVSSGGIRTARSWSRRTTRAIAAASLPGLAACAATLSSSSPSAGSARRSCATFSSVAATSPRAGRRRAGITVSRSQPSSAPAACRSASSPSRSPQLGQLGAAAQPSTTPCSITPSPSISIRTTSPGSRKRGGSSAMPTPLGVPVRIRSPGSSVIVSLMKSTSAGIAEDEVRRCSSPGAARR